METDDNLSDTEYLYKLRIEYLQAIQHDDYGRINSVIVPQFLERFGKHYIEYESGWRSLSLSRLPIRVVIDPKELKQKEKDWAENVLNGHIELVF
jgi:hypothetical protein